MRDGAAETVFQSFLREAIVISSAMDRTSVTERLKIAISIKTIRKR